MRKKTRLPFFGYPVDPTKIGHVSQKLADFGNFGQKWIFPSVGCLKPQFLLNTHVRGTLGIPHKFSPLKLKNFEKNNKFRIFGSDFWSKIGQN